MSLRASVMSLRASVMRLGSETGGGRLAPQPGERIDRTRTVSFTFDGRRIEAYEGDTIGSALFAAGQRTFSRSFKYHRRRGLMCCAGQCPNCLVAVDGAPGARACVEPVREGIKVQHLNAVPSLEFDVMRATDLVGGALTPPGFYYKTFIRPRKLWPLYEKILRNAAGLGRLRAEQTDREWRTEYRRRHADVLVVGGGLAGLNAALTAAELGADVVLADEGPGPGGQQLLEANGAAAAELAARAERAGVEILTRGSALGSFDGLVAVWQQDTLHQVRAAQLVFATGVIEQPLVFAGNDLPGVMLTGGARRLAALYGVAPGTRAVIATTSDRGLHAARALRGAGIEIAAVADLRPEAGELARGLRRDGIPVFAGHTVLEARGGKGVREVEIGPLGASGGRSLDCDLLAVCGGTTPATSLLLQAGATSVYEPARGHFALDRCPDGVYAAGEVTGVTADADVARSGQLAGLQAAHALGLGGADSREHARRLIDSLDSARELAPDLAVAPPVSGGGRGKCFACLCEDVTSKDIDYAIDEGYDSIELAKRYTTVTMGPCQGRMCQLPSVRLMAAGTGQDAELGRHDHRPPALGLGADGNPWRPSRRARQALFAARSPPRAGGQRQVGRGLAARL